MIGGKKGQAAIEFLTTYGWALLVIAIVLVALSWLGVFSPQNIIQEHCSFPVGTLGCNEVLIVKGSSYAGTDPGTNSVADARTLGVTNNFGKDIYVCYIFCSEEGPDPAKGYPTQLPAQTTACGSATTSAYRLKSGETANVGRDGPTNTWISPCLHKGTTYSTVKVGEVYRTNLYVFYSYPGETTGYARSIEGNVVTKIQPSS
ncbi:MAG: hypothetical protein WC759_03545 [Candidatus Micrarchaeia archaeon]|jgi:hypothetical protein